MEIPKASPEDELEFGMQDVGKGAWMPIPVEIPLPKCDTSSASPGPLVCVPSLFLGLIKSQLRAAQSPARLDLIGHLFSARKIIINVTEELQLSRICVDSPLPARGARHIPKMDVDAPELLHPSGNTAKLQVQVLWIKLQLFLLLLPGLRHFSSQFSHGSVPDPTPLHNKYL